MALTDFFRINFPYGIKRNPKNEWIAFNREYMPLGWNNYNKQISIYKDDAYSELPIYTAYTGLSKVKLNKLAHSPDAVKLDHLGKVNMIFFYNDKSNPQSNSEYWNAYFEKIKILSTLKVKKTET